MIKKYISAIAFLALAACSGGEEPTVSASATAPGAVNAAAQTSLKDAAGDTIYFAYDKYSLSDESVAVLDKQAAWLSKNPKSKVIVEGHCDDRGTRKYNQALGERRANAGKRYLVSKGVSTKRITTVSYGKDKPAVAGAGEDSYAKNRRDVTVVVK
jgi:peptidoglycan-associated lipoprotein